MTTLLTSDLNPILARIAVIEARLRTIAPDFGGIDPTWIVDKNGLGEIIGIQPRTVEIWVQERRIPVFKISHRCQRFRVADVVRALERFEVKEAGYAETK